MKKTLTLRLTKVLGLSTILLALFLTLGTSKASAQAGFGGLAFDAGSTQTLVVCQDAIATSINTMLAATDTAAGLTDVWSVVTAPANGTLSLSGFVATSTGASISPTGWSFTPSSGFSGSDFFVIQISNGIDSITTTIFVTVNPLPAVSAITGTFSECIGATTALADATAGGTWFVSDATIATISSSGVVTGLIAGTNTVGYSVTSGTTGCSNIAFATNTVLTVPVVPAIGGSSAVCVGSSTTLTDAMSSGTWTSSNLARATVDASGGTVFGISAGAVTISYSVTNTCGTGRNTLAMTVETGTVASITPAAAVSVCIGANTTLADATTGGTWGSTDATIATVNPATGVVTGVSTGTVTIVYTVTNSCGTHSQTKSVTVTTIPAAPPAIGGTASACVGAPSTLTNSTSGGTWSSANTAIATVNATGTVTGVSGGTTTITYTVFNSCGSNFITTSFTVNTVPAAPSGITGPTTLCVGSTTTLSDASGGGLWSSTATSVASIDATTGVVTGVAIGTTVISYTRTNICGSTAAFVTDTVTNVPTAPAAIGGATTVCVGATISLTDATAGGVWSSGTTAVASITTTGIVRGMSIGSSLISYTVTNFCGTSAATSTVTVNDVPVAPGAPSGAATVCVGANTTFTDASSGGTWSSSNTAVATVNSSGVVTGISTGTVNISYTLTNSCGSTSSTASLTVNTVPVVAAIGGTLAICNGATTTLTNTTTGGTWSSGTPSVASIDASGLVTGLSAGSTIITYAVSNVCGTTNRTATVTVTNPPATPAAIGGATSLCVGSTITLTDATAGGAWSSSATGIATISNTGIVTGVATGSATITYTSTNFCGSTFAVLSITVLTLPAPAAITGAASVCVGAAITLADATGGGVWSSTNSAIATVDGSGNVTGVSAGSVTISYNITNICGTGGRARAITVNTVPATPPAIGGPASVCVGASVSETDATGGGAWTSSNTAVASINSGTGATFGVTSGSVIITYTVTNVCGSAFITKAFSVGTVPALGSISGTSPMCAGTTATFTDTSAGGAWTTTNAAIASVNAASGLVTAVAVGTANISYTKSNVCGSSSTGFVLTVTTVPGLPAAITGAAAVCTGATITLSDATAGGTWNSSNIALASVDGSGNVTGIAGGSVTISYTVSNSCGSSAPRTKIITVNTPPVVAAIGGTTTICMGTSTVLTDATAAGVWSSSNTAVATINSGSGLTNALTVGTSTISYTVTNGCGSTSATRVFTVTTVPATPPAITGITSVCVSSTTTLSDSVSGGTWTTSNAAIASVISATGVVTGVAGGTANITYTLTNSCGSTTINTTVTVNTVPSAPAAIAGANNVCAGSTTTFTDATAGGVWTSSAPGVATVDPSSGVITGITAGSAATISYTVSNGCGPTTVTKGISVITVPVVAAIGGSTTVCTGSSTTLTDATAGGTWSTSDATIASVSTTGVVTGVSGTPTGLTAVISYAVTNACGTTSATRTVTVITTPAAPAAISGTTTFCVGTTTSLTDATAGGVWSSVTTGVASVNATGVVTGITTGTSVISYTLTNTCGPTAATTTVNVIAIPVVAPITGPTLECVGSSITMSSTTPGGTWISSVPSVATVNTTGVVTGATAGTTLIVYSITNICGTTVQTRNDTVINGSVSAITGAATVCVGANTTLSDVTTGGTWSSSNFTIGTVNSATGVVTGVSGGSITITYSVTTACGTNTSVHAMTVNVPGVAAITGTTTVCVAANTSLSDATVGGTWSSLSTAIATVDPSTGVVTGVSAGTTTIIYTLINSCGTYQSFATITVNPLPAPGAISGLSVVCEAATITLTDPAAGGTWSSTATGIATVSTTGIVTGVSAGSATISYTVTNSCGTAAATQTITVNPLPHAGTIAGPTDVCEASAITLTDAITGGTWSSSSIAIASVDATGTVSGISAGSATISYSFTNTCGTDVAVYSILVHPLPVVAAITGTTIVCEASTTTLTDPTSGGTWSSSSIATASIDATGIVYGIAAGSATISYTVVSPFTCTTVVTTTVTVNPLPVAGTISGPSTVCESMIITLTDGAAGGTWTSGTSGHASVGVTGSVLGLSPGIDTIFYVVTNSCGTATAIHPVTVNPLPHAGAITGTASVVCEGATISLSSTTAGGTWTSGTPSVATIDASGTVTGISAGSTTISYSVTNSCGTDVSIFVVTVNPLPVAGTISGSPTVCETATTTYTDAASGGIWSSSVTGNATISTTGIVTGIVAGADTVFYTVTNSCGTAIAIKPITVLPLPHAGSILGLNVVCVSAIISLSDTATGGTWSSSIPGVATVSSTGVVTGIAPGIAVISYTVTNSCGTDVATHTVTVNPLPFAGTITGTPVVCVGATTALTDPTSGGSWSSGNTAVATVNSSGLVTGVSAGLAIISYSVTNSCGTATDTMMVRVNPLPNAGTISGPSVVCVNANITLTDASAGGTWISTNTGIATVNGAGLVHGVAAGFDTIRYRVTNSCGTDSTMYAITVNPLPNAGTISGLTAVCVGDSITLTDTSGGGAGTWTVTLSTVAVLGTGTGVIRGIGAGTAHVTYSVTNSCGTATSAYTVTVNPLPNAGTISGPTSVCAGSNITLTDAGGVGAGSWTSGSLSIASVNSLTGVVHGIAAGTDTITYTATTATCGSASTTYVVTVIALPLAGTIYGPSTVCVGNAITLGDTTASTAGTWSCVPSTVANIDASGNVVGVSAGTATISYTVTTTCGTVRATYTVTVIGVPSAGTISGTTILCEGSSAVFTDAAAGGTWSSSDITVASISTGGTVTGISAGTATISYTVSNACATVSATLSITINPLPRPGAITPGSFSLCQGDSTLLTDTATGGVWSSVSSGIATVSTSGTVYAVSGGTTVIHYCKTNSCGTLCANATITVNPLPVAGTITGSATVCEASTTTLHDFTGTAGGTWSSSGTGIATINSSTGVVTGVSAGTVTITYIVSTATCGSDSTYFTLTVNPLPHAGTITGASTICTGTTIALTDTFSGGTWSSSGAAATVSSTGIVTGVTAGTVTISYVVTNSCGTSIATHVVTVSVTPTAGSIVGPTSLCPGTAAHITLSDVGGTPGGRWSSSVTSIATVDSVSGVVTGITAGIITITYSFTSAAGCGTVIATRVDTVNAAPDAGTITGASSVCNGACTTFIDTAAGGSGSWSSFSSAIATASSGVVCGVSVGITTISYSVTNSCGTATATASISVLALPSGGTISGPSTLCVGVTTTFTETGGTIGGVWSSSDYTIANVVSGSGAVTGVSGGTATITYTGSTASCGSAFSTRSVTILPLANPGTISGPTNVCVGSFITLSETVSGTGTWSGGSGHATVGGTTGTVTGTSAGTAIITYSVTNSCGTQYTTYAVTVDPLAVAGTITGPTHVCLGSTITVGSTGTAGGAWTTASATYITITSGGAITGVSVGSTTITYTATTVCSSSMAIATITVDPLPDAGTLSGYSGPICAGTSVTLYSSISGGTFASFPSAIASVGATSGTVTGIAGGTALIVYTVSSAYCGSDTASMSVSVLPLPAVGAIGGSNHVCLGANTTLTDGSAGGTWSSANSSIASISTTGVVTGMSLGTTTISNGVTNSCCTNYVPFSMTVDPMPVAGTISGAATICLGATTTYTSSGTGGTWSSSPSGFASIVGSTGFITGIAAGTATITYLVSTTYCGTAFDTAIITVLAPPHVSIITGADTLCEGSVVLLTDSVSGGTWTSSVAGVAAVSSAGYVTGIASGTSVIRYTLTNMCGTDIRSHTVVVNPLPHAGTITGSSILCVGTPVTLTASVPGGTWFASNSVATVTTTGSVLGTTIAGNDTIYYVVTNSCGTDTSMRVVTVNLLPNAGLITASKNWICAGDSLRLSNLAVGGFWSTSNAVDVPLTSLGTIISPSQAEVYGGNPLGGTSVITYTFVNACGTATDTMLITVRALGHCNDEVEQNIKTVDVGIYPNPAVSILHIEAPVKVNVSVVSPDGKVVIEQKATTDIDVRSLASGLYMIMIYDENNALLKVSKFIKAD